MTTHQDTRIAHAYGSRARRGALVAFFVILALTGGGSRADILSLVVLRPVAVLFAAYAILAAPPGSLRAVRGALVLLAVFAAMVAVQLVPLPPGVWHSLPAREPIERIDTVVGLAGAWRPLTMSPAGSWNALFALVVPAAAVLLYGALDEKDRPVVLSLWLGFAVASACLGLAQLLGDPEGPLYPYAITNGGDPVGLLSNANHQAIVLLSAIPLAAFWGSRPDAAGTTRILRGSLMAGLFLFVTVLTASRAGLALSVPASIIAGLLLMRAAFAESGKKRAEKARLPVLPRSVLIGGALVATVAIVGAGILALAARTGGLAALLTTSAQEELRFKALPALLELLQRVWLLGTGAGSFDKVYRTVEPVASLSRYYLNHAHNDWLEVLLTHGLAGLIALVAVVLWATRSARVLWRTGALSTIERIALAFPLPAVAAFSLVDYPLRTPVVVALFVLLVLLLRDGRVLAAEARAPRRGRGRARGG